VQMEIDHGVLPGGQRYIGEAALMQRREPQIATGVDRHYAMALGVDNSDGVTVIDHGGDMGGFHSNMMWWPAQKVGAVILTNADEGVYMRGPFKRRLMELMFDGNPQAQAAAAATVKANSEGFDAFVKLLQWPADATALDALAPRYRNAALGELAVTRKDGRACSMSEPSAPKCDHAAARWQPGIHDHRSGGDRLPVRARLQLRRAQAGGARRPARVRVRRSEVSPRWRRHRAGAIRPGTEGHRTPALQSRIT